MEKHLVDSVRELFGFYESTTQLSIFLPREHGGLGIKKISNVYYTTRIAYLVKMLNHNVDKFKGDETLLSSVLNCLFQMKWN